MDFRLDEGQIELQQTVERFCSARFPLDEVGGRERTATDRACWSEMADLGIFGLLLSEGDGGSGLGVVEAAIVFEQLGSHLAPGPVLWTMLSASIVSGAATGDQLVGGVGSDAIVDGVALVEHAEDIDALLVIDDERVVLHRTAELAAHPMDPLDPLDPLTPVSRLSGLEGGTYVGDAAAAGELRVLGTVLCAAQLAGIASRALDVARSYALDRQQFGAPIGSFQAVKHMLADMYVQSSLAQSAVYASAAVLDEAGRAAAERAARGAKLLAAEAAISNASTAIQVLGGMGFTWDMLPNYLLKRAWVLDQSFGAGDDHALHLGTSFAGASA